MGDFNVDALDHEANQRLWGTLESHDLVVSGPTHLDGGLLDHVYLLKSFMGGKKSSFVNIKSSFVKISTFLTIKLSSFRLYLIHKLSKFKRT